MRKIGHGPAPAVALHCTLAHGGAWAPMVAVLADRLTLLAPDLPGHGTEPDWEGGDYLAASLAALETLPTGPRHFIGHSFGAVVALEYALRSPERVLSLTMIEPVLFAAASEETRARNAGEWKDLDEYFATGDRAGAARAFTATWGGDQSWETLPRAARERIAGQIHIIPDQTPVLHEDSAGLLTPGRLEAFNRPVLLLDGAESPPIVDDILKTLAARLPRARRVTIPEAGHMVPLTHPEETAAAVAELMQANDPPAALA